MREVRKIDNMKVRTMCIKDGYYTRGTCEQYDNLLYNLCDKEEVTLEDIEKIAVDILDHSDWRAKKYEYGCSFEELQAIVMTKLINECCKTFVELK